ncbi:unnamed protein product [Didymodactylos carnosus]|uniref:Uncharacterized protein n=1 Tax=Didymodactylos carnosus TaxID=1234261 RepID=A0A814R5J7_9BILA|nr:unnamed protein product [Didymodactylos carnosus]CAF1129354.1 unnamed protein product [Didymodactylos carnosus]CAF3874899.1 unnamed protein product [Didymodactylos carnosus]CAF3893032.1 unnamed protein product [Didymodactylos carnosus]
MSTKHCPSPGRVKCSACQTNAIGRCDGCGRRFNLMCFQQHDCTAARTPYRTTARLKPECQFCSMIVPIKNVKS